MKRVAICGVMIALCLMFSYIEVLIPIMPSVPGIKLGLSNGLVLIILYIYGFREAFLVQVSRILLCAVLFGNPIAFFYSISAGVISLMCMVFFKRINAFPIIFNGMAGGMIHNAVQVVVAYLFIGSGYIYSLLPILIIAGAVCGLLTGFLSSRIVAFYNKTGRTDQYDSLS